MCNPVTHFRGLHTLCYLLLGGHSPKEQTDVFLTSLYILICLTDLPGWFQQFNRKESACNAEDPGSIPGLERSPCMRKWQPTQIFLPRRSMDRGAWQATVPGVTKSCLPGNYPLSYTTADLVLRSNVTCQTEP